MSKERIEAEMLIYQVMDKLDHTGKNSAYYKELFSKMSDSQFKSFISKDFSMKFQTRLFEIEPNMNDIANAAKILNVPLFEKIKQPYTYKDKEGNAVESHECMVGYIHIKKMKQFISKKNSMSTNIDQRDMRTGLLVHFDKNGATSDREFEALAVMGLDKTIDEISRPRADAMKAKDKMLNTINLLGFVSLEDVPVDQDETLSKNMLDTYLLGSQIKSNLVSDDYNLPINIRGKERKVTRES